MASASTKAKVYNPKKSSISANSMMKKYISKKMLAVYGPANLEQRNKFGGYSDSSQSNSYDSVKLSTIKSDRVLIESPQKNNKSEARRRKHDEGKGAQ